MSTSIAKKLRGLVTEVSVALPNKLLMTIDASNMVKTAQKLREMGFDHAKSVTGTDYPEENRLEIVYHVSSFENLELATFMLQVKTSVSRSDPKVSSLANIWPSAEYLEKETSDLLGVVFEGQSDQGRLLLPESFAGGPPLRKDFKIKTEGIDA